MQEENLTPQDEQAFWASFGYIEDGLVYCSVCEDTHVKGMTNHE